MHHGAVPSVTHDPHHISKKDQAEISLVFFCVKKFFICANLIRAYRVLRGTVTCESLSSMPVSDEGILLFKSWEVLSTKESDYKKL